MSGKIGVGVKGTLDDVGGRIQRARIAAGISQEGLEQRLGWGGKSVGSIERGVREPKLSEVRAVAQELNVSAAALLGEESRDGEGFDYAAGFDDGYKRALALMAEHIQELRERGTD